MKKLLIGALAVQAFLPLFAQEKNYKIDELWSNPPVTCKPHTRWWWPGNAVTKEGIDFQLEEMHKNGMGGVEIMSFLDIFTKGNIPFGSPEFFEMVKHAVQKAKSLDMKVTISFGPGWNFGNAEVTEADGMRNLIIDEQGEFEGVVSLKALGNKVNTQYPYGKSQPRKLELLLATKLDAKNLANETIVLTDKVKGDLSKFSDKPGFSIEEKLPAGKWRVTAFWNVQVNGGVAAGSTSWDGKEVTRKTILVNHFDKDAVKRMADNMFSKYEKYIGEEFGKTVDCVFNDSFELRQDDFYWTDGFFDYFKEVKGYDLRPMMSEMINGKSERAPYLKYDFNHVLHLKGMDGIVSTMEEECTKRGMDMRQQPHYRFAAELMEASGKYKRPETEMNVRIFDPKFYPHKLTTSAVRLYGGKWTSSECFTFNNAKYKSSLEELKRSTDGFLRDNVTQFYNHGYFYTPEKTLSVARDLIWMNRISHVNTWWPYYKHLTAYTARAAALCRYGRFESDILVYSANDTMWSEKVFYPCGHVRDVPCGELPKFLLANGYDFDAVNNDLILKSEIKNGKMVINGYDYSMLFLPRAIYMPIPVLEKIKKFVEDGGKVVALDKLPTYPIGMKDLDANKAAVTKLVNEIFNPKGMGKSVGKGRSYFAPAVKGFDYLQSWSPSSKEYEPTELSSSWANVQNFLKQNLTPDFEFASGKPSQGLTFYRNKYGETDVYFVTNLSPNVIDEEIILDVKGKNPEIWDPMTGEKKPMYRYDFVKDGRVKAKVQLDPWASYFIVLEKEASKPALISDNVSKILNVSKDSVKALVDKKGEYFADIKSGDNVVKVKANVKDNSPEIEIGKDGWNLNLTSIKGKKFEKNISQLERWETMDDLKHFSGEGIYKTTFEVPVRFFTKDKKLSYVLDLGEVYVCAKVFINGKEIGDVWMNPYKLDLPSDIFKPGKNEIEIRVVNQLWNHARGVTEVEPVADDLKEHYGEGYNEQYNAFKNFTTIAVKRDKSFLPSGLVGPVKIKSFQEVELK